jgi:hypothetical protein
MTPAETLGEESGRGYEMAVSKPWTAISAVSKSRISTDHDDVRDLGRKIERKPSEKV